MSHALIIDDNLLVSRAIKSRLETFGYDSFDQTWAERQALAAAAARRPDLIVVGDSMANGSPMPVAERLARENGVPVLMVTAHRVSLQRSLPEGAMIDGPYGLGELDAALEAMGAAT